VIQAVSLESVIGTARESGAMYDASMKNRTLQIPRGLMEGNKHLAGSGYALQRRASGRIWPNRATLSSEAQVETSFLLDALAIILFISAALQ